MYYNMRGNHTGSAIPAHDNFVIVIMLENLRKLVHSINIINSDGTDIIERLKFWKKLVKYLKQLEILMLLSTLTDDFFW
jgi:hypothetical protein